MIDDDLVYTSSLVDMILNKQCYVTNPSLLKNYNFNSFILYHGSHSGLTGKIVPSKSRIKCDFGQGFYTGDMKIQAETLISEDTNGIMYDLEVSFDKLNVFSFNYDTLWALYVGANRGYIDLNKYPKFKDIVFKISSNDVVIGYIADDRMVYVYSAFIDGTMTDIALINCLKYVNMGKQYVFKTKRACSKIKILNRYHLDSDYRKVLLHDKHRTINEVQYVVEEMIKKYRRTGKYIDELLEVYK